MNMGGWREEPSLDEVAKQYPEWDCRQEISGLFYASHKVTGQHVHGEDPLDLRDQIRTAIARQEWIEGLAAPVPGPKPWYKPVPLEPDPNLGTHIRSAPRSE